MTFFRSHRPSPALLVAIIALVVALGGTSYAAFSVPRNSVGTAQLRKNAVTGKKIRNGAVTGNKIAKNTITGDKIQAGTLGTVPSAGNANALGGAPATAYQSRILWAKVAPDGTLSAGNGATSSGILKTGQYEVTFNRSVSACAFEATIGSSLVSNSFFNDNGQGQIYTEPRSGNPNAVFVAIFDKYGTTFANNAFHLAVIC